MNSAVGNSLVGVLSPLREKGLSGGIPNSQYMGISHFWLKIPNSQWENFQFPVGISHFCLKSASGHADRQPQTAV